MYMYPEVSQQFNKPIAFRAPIGAPDSRGFLLFTARPEGEIMVLSAAQSETSQWASTSQPCHQWPFQEPTLMVPTIYKAYFSGLNFRKYPHKIWPAKWY